MRRLGGVTEASFLCARIFLEMPVRPAKGRTLRPLLQYPTSRWSKRRSLGVNMSYSISVSVVFFSIVFSASVANAQLDDLFGAVEAAAQQAAEAVGKATQEADKTEKEDQSKTENQDGEVKELSLEEKFNKFAKEIEDEMERRELESNDSLRTVRDLQKEQKSRYCENHEEIKKLHSQKRTKQVREAMHGYQQAKRLAGARLNELEMRAEVLMSTSGGGSQNDDLMRKVQQYSRELSAKERSEFHRNQKIQQKYNALNQKVISSRHRHHYNRKGFTDLTAGLVEELAIDGARHPEHPGTQKGTLSDTQDALNRILKLTWRGDTIAIDRGHWTNCLRIGPPKNKERRRLSTGKKRRFHAKNRPSRNAV